MNPAPNGTLAWRLSELERRFNGTPEKLVEHTAMLREIATDLDELRTTQTAFIARIEHREKEIAGERKKDARYRITTLLAVITLLVMALGTLAAVLA